MLRRARREGGGGYQRCFPAVGFMRLGCWESNEEGSSRGLATSEEGRVARECLDQEAQCVHTSMLGTAIVWGWFFVRSCRRLSRARAMKATATMSK